MPPATRNALTPEDQLKAAQRGTLVGETPEEAAGGGAVAAAAAGVAATGAGTSVTGGATAPAIPATAVLSAEAGAVVGTAVAALRALRPGGSGGDDVFWLWMALREDYPDGKISDGDLSAVADRERAYENEFWRRVGRRLRRDLPEALKADDPRGAVDKVLKRERRWTLAHHDAALGRSRGAISRAEVKSASPEGAYWIMSPRLNHCPTCLAMAGVGWWSWEILDLIHPPVHPVCGCELLGAAEARRRNLIGDKVPDTASLKAKAKAMGLLEADHHCCEEADQHKDGVMVALYPDPNTAVDLALPAGEQPGDLHMTLAYMGNASELGNADAVIEAVRGWASRCPKLDGEISGTGKFVGGKEPVTYASVDLPDLPENRQSLIDALEPTNAPAKTDHGYTPHITLDYASRRPKIERPIPLCFTEVHLVWGEEHYSFPLGGDALTEARELEELRWQRRFAAGLTKGGQFMPARGGISPRVTLQDVMRALFGKDAPEIRERGAQRSPATLTTTVGKVSDGAATARKLDGLDLKRPRKRGQPPTDIGEVVGAVRARFDNIAEERKVDKVLGEVTFNPDWDDTEGLRSWEGDVTLGPDAQVSIEQLGQMRGADQTIPDELAGQAYHGYRVINHEMSHGVNPQTPDQYHGSGRAIEEALVEEIAHEMTVAQLREDGQWEALRWLARNPDDPRARGMYQPQRVGLKLILDEAEVPLTERRALVEELKFGVSPGKREAILGGLISRAQGVTPEEGRGRVTALMAQADEIDPLQQAGTSILRQRNDTGGATLKWVGAEVDVPGRYSGTVTDASFDSEGRTYLELRIETPDGVKYRYPMAADATITKKPKAKALKGERVTGSPKDGSKVTVTQLDGKEMNGTLQRVGGGEGDWRAEIRTGDGEVYPITKHSVRDVKVRKGAGKGVGPEGVETPATGPPEPPSEAFRRHAVESAASKVHEDWREGMRTPDGGYEVREKLTKDKAWIEAHGTDRVDLAQTSFEDLPEDWKKENLEGTGDAFDAIKAAKADGGTLDIEALSSAVHDGWVKRNKNAPAEQKKPYADLTDEDKQKDRNFVLRALEAMGIERPDAQPGIGDLDQPNDPTSFDARRYSNPRRSLIKKAQALKAGQVLEMADGTTVMKGTVADSLLVRRPDGSRRRYVTAQRMSNAEIRGIAERHGVLDRTEIKRPDDDLTAKTMTVKGIRAKYRKEANDAEAEMAASAGTPGDAVRDLIGDTPGSDARGERAPEIDKAAAENGGQASPSLITSLKDGQGPVESFLRNLSDGLGVDPYDIDSESLSHHAEVHEREAESRFEVGDVGLSPCANARGIDYAVHVLLPEMLREKFPKTAEALRGTSPRWGHRAHEGNAPDMSRHREEGPTVPVGAKRGRPPLPGQASPASFKHKQHVPEGAIEAFEGEGGKGGRPDETRRATVDGVEVVAKPLSYEDGYSDVRMKSAGLVAGYLGVDTPDVVTRNMSNKDTLQWLRGGNAEVSDTVVEADGKRGTVGGIDWEAGTADIWEEKPDTYEGEPVTVDLADVRMPQVLQTALTEDDGKLMPVANKARREVNPDSIRVINLLDYLIDNRDRHGGNYLVDKGGKAHPIDHDGTFYSSDSGGGAHRLGEVDGLSDDERAAIGGLLRDREGADGLEAKMLDMLPENADEAAREEWAQAVSRFWDRTEKLAGGQASPGDHYHSKPPKSDLVVSKVDDLSPEAKALRAKLEEIRPPKYAFRTENAHSAYKGMTMLGDGLYLTTDEEAAVEMQRDPHREIDAPDVDVQRPDRHELDPNLEIAMIDEYDLPQIDRKVVAGEALRKAVLQLGYDGIYVKSESLNTGGNQLVLYNQPKPGQDSPGLQKAKDDWFDYGHAEAVKAASAGESKPAHLATGDQLTDAEWAEARHDAQVLQRAASTGDTGHQKLMRGETWIDEGAMKERYAEGNTVTLEALTAASPDPEVADIYTDLQVTGDEGRAALLDIESEDTLRGVMRDRGEAILPKGQSYEVSDVLDEPGKPLRVRLIEKGGPTGPGAERVLRAQERQSNQDSLLDRAQASPGYTPGDDHTAKVTDRLRVWQEGSPDLAVEFDDGALDYEVRHSDPNPGPFFRGQMLDDPEPTAEGGRMRGWTRNILEAADRGTDGEWRKEKVVLYVAENATNGLDLERWNKEHGGRHKYDDEREVLIHGDALEGYRRLEFDVPPEVNVWAANQDPFEEFVRKALEDEGVALEPREMAGQASPGVEYPWFDGTQVYEDPEIDGAADAWAAGLTPEERSQVEGYTEIADASDWNLLDEASSTGTLPGPTTLYRAVANHDPEAQAELLKLKPGDEWSNGGKLISTSTDERVSREDFGENLSFGEGDDIALLEMKAPAYHAVGFPSLSSEMFRDQKEVLLPTDQRARVLEVSDEPREHGSGKIRRIKMELGERSGQRSPATGVIGGTGVGGGLPTPESDPEGGGQAPSRLGGQASPNLHLPGIFGGKPDKSKGAGHADEVERSKAEAPPSPVEGIPSYEDVELTDHKAAGGSNGARFMKDADGNDWIMKHYKGDQQRVATELLANAIYREAGVPVPNAGMQKQAGEYDFTTIKDVDVDEPPLPKAKKGQRNSTGIIVMEPDGRIWIYQPKGGFGGYKSTFSKGGLEKGLTPQQNAHKELWEEMGIRAEISGYLGDYEGDTSTSRFYLARRTSEPFDAETAETDSVGPVTPEEAADRLNRARDLNILADAVDRIEAGWPGEQKALTEGEPERLPKAQAIVMPLVDGGTKHWSNENEALAEGFVADALLANWDVVGLSQDNVLWAGDVPIRVDQGGTLEMRAQGGPKPFGPVPTELWTMNQPGGQAFGRMKLTEEGMRAAAKDVELRLTPERIDELVDAAPFTDDEMRERVRENLKARVDWLGRFSRGDEGLPEPLEGAELKQILRERDVNLNLSDDEALGLAAVLTTDYMGRYLDKVPWQKADEGDGKLPKLVKALDGLLKAQVTEAPEDSVAYMALDSINDLGIENLDDAEGRWFREGGFLKLDLEDMAGEGKVAVRVTIPAGTHMVAPTAEMLGVKALPGDGSTVLPRGVRLKVVGAAVEDGRVTIEMVAANR